MSVFLLILSLLFILMAAEGFTNAVEALGRRFALSQAVTGSILAAVGTAMPETILPVVAIFATAGTAGKEIGVGAILGAPFMLGTLAFLLLGITVLVSWLRKKRPFAFTVEPGPASRDLTFFILMYSTGIFLPMLLGAKSHVPVAILLLAGYLVYLVMTVRGESADLEEPKTLYSQSLLQKTGLFRFSPAPLLLIPAQLVLMLLLMIYGAHLFVDALGELSVRFGLKPLIFSLLLAPVATELPEKFNSVTWTLKKKDALAFGNITGAMVFQSTFPVSVGLLFTDWNVSGMALFSATLALGSALLALVSLRLSGRLSPYVILCCGLLYLVYIGGLILMGTL